MSSSATSVSAPTAQSLGILSLCPSCSLANTSPLKKPQREEMEKKKIKEYI